MPAALGTDLKGQSNLAGDANAGQREHAPFAAHCESLPRSDLVPVANGPHELCPSVSLRVFTLRQGGGIVGEPEWIERPRPGRSLEKGLVKTLRTYFRNVEAEASSPSPPPKVQVRGSRWDPSHGVG